MFRRRIRPVLFWLHLVLGLSAAVVIAIVALTGALLAFEGRILAVTERDHAAVAPASAGTSPLAPAALVARIAQQHPTDRVLSLRLHADPSLMPSVRLRDGGTRWVHPVTGETSVREKETLREFFSLMLRWHRWLAAPRDATFFNQALGRSLVGWSTAILLVLSISGLILWWPRAFSRRALEFLTLPRLRWHGRLRHWNWHNAFGFLSVIPIIVLSLTGLVMAFDPVKNFLYPEQKSPALKIPAPADKSTAASPDLIFARTVAAVPDWQSLLFYLPRQEDNGAYQVRPLTIYAYTAGWPSSVSTPLRFDPFTGALLETSRFADLPLASALRALNRDIHTGEAFGLLGEIAAFVTCLATLVLIYTGVALSLHRLRRYLRRESHPAA